MTGSARGPGRPPLLRDRRWSRLREMAAVVRVARAVNAAFPSGGLSVWCSNGAAAHQEVPHVHIHVHPRRPGDGLLRVYPGQIDDTPPAVLDALAEQLRRHLDAEPMPA